jgi:hypothetical protein
VIYHVSSLGLRHLLVLGSCRSGVEQVKPREIGGHALLLIGLVGVTGHGRAQRGEREEKEEGGRGAAFLSLPNWR